MATTQPVAQQSKRTLVKVERGIYRRPNGRFEIRFRDGFGRQRSRSARTLSEARKQKARVTTEVQQGTFLSDAPTFAVYLPHWEESFEGTGDRGIRPGTKAGYVRVLRKHALPFLGRVRLSQITVLRLEAFKRELQGKNLKPRSVRNVFRALSVVLGSATRQGLIRSNPVREVVLPGPATNSERQALTNAELLALEAALPERWRLFARFMAETGLRIGEAVALNWRDLDLRGIPHASVGGVVRVTKTFYGKEFSEPKTAFGKRSVPLSEEVTLGLIATGRSHLLDEPVFTSPTGKRMNSGNVRRRVFNPTAAKLDLHVWTGFHTLRRTCASWLVAPSNPNRLNDLQLQRWLGHASAAFTRSVYVSVLDEDVPTAEVVSGMFAGPAYHHSADLKGTAQ